MIYKKDGILFEEEFFGDKTRKWIYQYNNKIDLCKNVLNNDLISGVWILDNIDKTHGDVCKVEECRIDDNGISHDATKIIVEFINGKFLSAWNSEWGGILNPENQ